MLCGTHLSPFTLPFFDARGAKYDIFATITPYDFLVCSMSCDTRHTILIFVKCDVMSQYIDVLSLGPIWSQNYLWQSVPTP
jgi:hypothetical protein